MALALVRLLRRGGGLRSPPSMVLKGSGYGIGTGTRSLSATVRITFVDKDHTEIPVDAPVGKSLLEVAHSNDIELEGACDGSLACSTCHLILDAATFKKLKPPEEEELDMLDLAFDLQPTYALLFACTSRSSCRWLPDCHCHSSGTSPQTSGRWPPPAQVAPGLPN